MSCRGCILDAAGFHQPYPTSKTQILHLLFHKFTFFEFDSEMVFLTDNGKFTEEKDVVLFGISTQTHASISAPREINSCTRGLRLSMYKILFISSWKSAGALATPKGITFHLKTRRLVVLKASSS